MAGEKHILLNIRGDWTDSELAGETWQVGLRCALVAGADVDPVGDFPSTWALADDSINRTETDWTITSNWHAYQGSDDWNPDDWLNDQVAPAVIAWIAALSATSNKCRVRALACYAIGAPSGKALPAPSQTVGAPALLTWTGSYPVGGSGGELLPIENAVVASHRTQLLGGKGRGRMYLPGLTAGGMDGHGRLSSTLCSGDLAAQVGLLEGIQMTAGTTFGWSVRAVVTGNPWKHYGVIDQVRVGNVADTQRRRRRQLDEVYTSGSVSI